MSESFQTSVRRLKKRYARVTEDLKRAIQSLQADPAIGNLIPDDYGARKLRLPNSSAQRGKSGGFRLIYYVQDRGVPRPLAASGLLEERPRKHKPI